MLIRQPEETCHKLLIFRSNWLCGLLECHTKIGSLPQAKSAFLWDLTKENATVTIMKSALQCYYTLRWQSNELCQRDSSKDVLEVFDILY